METKEKVDWDFFWKRVRKHPLFLEFLYFLHLKKYRKVLEKIELREPSVLEVGAGTGAASVHVQDLYGGNITLVDNNEIAYEMHKKLFRNKAAGIRYLREDFLKIDRKPEYDLVMSDGLLEHFSKKEDIIELHKSFTKVNGYILIFALNNNLFTWFLELGEKKMGYSEPINMDECMQICIKSGLKVVGTVKYFFEYGILCEKVGENG
ncbi:methyltransferase family protein [Kineothrix alysoides]|uniref:Methyltransferase family protein n=1 Tax=Kineothrix alysoides TaxID=1469948 RepID=A0A4R1QVM1_9FIRM|nr:class I SAM-dependent methyltransferase [Kineothrix alysoides]TCL57637.1 methyltransferase family protein [Kineothrix alysoides]